MSRLLVLCTGLNLAAAIQAQIPECRPLPGADDLR
jgi:hypothetical protein